MKLRTKFAIMLLVMTVVLAGTVYGSLELHKDRLVQQNREDVNETATLAARQLGEAIEDRKDYVGYVASRPAAARFDTSDRFLRQFVDNSRYSAAQIVDANGTIVDYHGDVTQDIQQEAIGADIGDRPYVARPLAGELYVSEPAYVNATDQYLIIFSAPIIDDRTVTGVLATAIYLDEQTFFGMLRPLSRGGQRVTVTAGSATLYRGGETIEDSYSVSRTVAPTGWTVTVDRDRSNLLDRLRELAVVQGLGIFIVMLTIVGFGVWEYRTTLAQAEELLRGFSALQAGSYDHELSLAAATEWEQISQGFNTLAAGLASREEKLRQREQRLGVLNRVLRHNLRNAASVLMGYAEVIRDWADDEQILDAVERIETTGENLGGLSERARHIAHITEQREDRVRLDVTRLVSDVLASMQAEYPGVDVGSTMPPSAWVYAHSSIRLAIVNVCENACEHTHANEPKLTVVVRPRPDAVTIEITDNGEGIPDQEWEVLDAGEETPLEHGSGLGLWVAKWAVERSGGTLHFETSEPTGTTVTIELEAAEPGQPVDQATEREASGQPKPSDQAVETAETDARWPEDWPTYADSAATVNPE